MLNASPQRRNLVPSTNIDYSIMLTSAGYVMRDTSGRELQVRDMYQESFEVLQAQASTGLCVGTVVTLSFTERGDPFFSDEQSNQIEIASVAGKVTLRCVTPLNK